MSLLKTSLVKLVAASAIGVASMNAAHAIPFVLTDTYDPADFRVAAPSTITINHDVTDQGFRAGDDVFTALLTVFLADDVDVLQSESVRFNFDGTGWTSSDDVNGVFSSLLLIPDVFTFPVGSLLDDGRLTVNLQALAGDFFFLRSELTVIGNSRVARVPEPMSLTIFGLGLLALPALLWRRRTQATAKHG
jgi:hypothetical protein